MKWLWTWSGRSFGYREGDDLWTHDGQHVGKFSINEEIYGPNGQYLGELLNERLITNLSKKHFRSYNFSPYACRVAFVKYIDYVGFVMYAGYEDFPKLER